MSHAKQYIAAVDIGTTKIVTIVGTLNENHKLQILGMSKEESFGVKRGVVLNIEETVQSIKKTVEEAQNQSGIQFSNVYVGIAGQHIRSMRNRGYIYRDTNDDEITREDIQNLLSDMRRTPVEIGEEIIHVLPQNFIVDNETGVKNPVGMSGRRLEGNFHIVIGQIASAKNIARCISRVNLKVNSLILEPLASAAAVLTADEKEAGVALVDIGGGTTDVAVYHDDIIRHTAVIPFGGHVITKDIKEGCSILSRYAEKLKIEYGSALGDLAPDDQVVTIPGISGREAKEISFKSLAYIIQSRMEEIIDAVMFEIENSGQLEKLSAGIVLTGGGALLKHLPQLMKFRTGLDVRLGLPAEHLASDSLQHVNQTMYSTSVGLLLEGIHDLQEKIKDNIAPEPNVKREPIQVQKAPEKPVTREREAKEMPAQEETPKPENNTNGKKNNIFSALKTSITNMFDDSEDSFEE